MKQELEQLYAHIDEIEIAMMTTRRLDVHLVSRAMATQKRTPGADLWFVTTEGSPKLADVQHDPHVNLAYYKDRTREWVCGSSSVAMTAKRETAERAATQRHACGE